MRKIFIVLILLSLTYTAGGCAKKNPAVNQNIKTLVDGFQNSMVTYYSIKNFQDNALLLNDVNDSMKKVEDSQKKLEQLSGINETVTDDKLKAELANFIDLGRERERLVMKYIDDIRRDLDYKYQNPDAQVDINTYITQIPNNLLNLEYQSGESTNRLQQLLTQK